MNEKLIPWNPTCISIGQAMECVDFTRTIFEMSQNGASDAQIVGFVEQTINHYRRLGRKA